jgi:hypothetical protein
VLVWDPDRPAAGPVELGRHDRTVRAMVALAGGRLVTAVDDGRLLVWDPARASSQVIQLTCPVSALATVPGLAWSDLVIAHRDDGFSLWSFMRYLG